ncbi:hypothetical protein GCM10009760_57910 [Kitasatospora kazusensis]|uniref:HTH araC/xylS-type domain-containing protein n=1 Tax=Kitasatospora kazusensis TaxID=407974 RepID=A0ABP5M251_9ACTN
MPRKLSGRRRRETVAVLIFGGAPIFESSIPLSVFGVDRQDAGVPRYRLLVCAGEDGPLSTTGGLTLTAPYGLEALARAGTIVVPAWRSISQPPPVEAIAALRKAHHEGARIIGLCTGAFVLAAAGLLDGRPATTHWMYAPTLAKRYPRVHVDPRELFVDDGDVLTSAGTAAGIDLCLHVVRSDHGAEAANALARRLVVPSRRGGGGQAQYIDQSLPEEIGNDPLAEVVTWALENLNQQFDVEVLAARAYMSRRTFDRRFRTLTGSAPLQWLITQRVLQAQRLLETSELSVDDVARRCGFRSPVALRGHFRRQLGVSPATYRTTYRARRPAPVSGVPSQAHPADRLNGALNPGGPLGSPGSPNPIGAGTPASGPGGPGGPGTAAGAPGVTAPGGAGASGHPAPGLQRPGAGAGPAGAPGKNRVRPLVPAQSGPATHRPLRTPEAGGERPADGSGERTAVRRPTHGVERGVDGQQPERAVSVERPGERPAERAVERSVDHSPERAVEHAVAEEDGHGQPSARGLGQGHRPEGAGRTGTRTDGDSDGGGGAARPAGADRELSASRDRAVG